MSRPPAFFIALAAVLLLFAAVHFFHDPFRVIAPVAESMEERVLQAGEPAQVLAIVQDAQPGAWYRATATVEWRAVQADTPDWRTARVVLGSHDVQGRWIPAHHVLCSLTESGQARFMDEFKLPDGVAQARMTLQHMGLDGWIALRSFSLDEVERNPVNRWLYPLLRLAWLCVAGWGIWLFGLVRTPSGYPVIVMAGLIAVTMLIPQPAVRETHGLVADVVRPPEIIVAEVADPAPGITPARPKEVVTSPPPERERRVRDFRVASAQWVRGLDIHFWGHLGMFMVLAVLTGIHFRRRRESVPWSMLLVGGVVYAVAAELLQATEITRSVRAWDIGISSMGWLVGSLTSSLVIRSRSPRRRP